MEDARVAVETGVDGVWVSSTSASSGNANSNKRCRDWHEQLSSVCRVMVLPGLTLCLVREHSHGKSITYIKAAAIGQSYLVCGAQTNVS